MMLLFPILMAVRTAEDDTNLVARMQRRDPQALAELYDRYGRVVYALILRVVRDTGIAEDLVQETFLRVWNRVHAFEPGKGALGPRASVDSGDCHRHLGHGGDDPAAAREPAG